MGLFDVPCRASGVVLHGRTRLLFLLVEKNGTKHPLLPPLRGTYDRLSKIDMLVPGAELAPAEALALRLKKGLEALLEEAFDGGVPFEKGTLRYALIDEVVYRAVVATVATGGKEGVPEDIEATL